MHLGALSKAHGDRLRFVKPASPSGRCTMWILNNYPGPFYVWVSHKTHGLILSGYPEFFYFPSPSWSPSGCHILHCGSGFLLQCMGTSHHIFQSHLVWDPSSRYISLGSLPVLIFCLRLAPAIRVEQVIEPTDAQVIFRLTSIVPGCCRIWVASVGYSLFLG